MRSRCIRILAFTAAVVAVSASATAAIAASPTTIHLDPPAKNLGVIMLSGTVHPRASTRHGDASGRVTLYQRTESAKRGVVLHQLGKAESVRSDGKFTLTYAVLASTRTYEVRYQPAKGGKWAASARTIRVTVG